MVTTPRWVPVVLWVRRLHRLRSRASASPHCQVQPCAQVPCSPRPPLCPSTHEPRRVRWARCSYARRALDRAHDVPSRARQLRPSHKSLSMAARQQANNLSLPSLLAHPQSSSFTEFHTLSAHLTPPTRGAVIPTVKAGAVIPAPIDRGRDSHRQSRGRDSRRCQLRGP